MPATRTEVFIELSEFVREFRERARVQGVTIRPGECFGFATYAQTGPEPEFLAAVHRQSVVMRHLLGALLESRPAGIMAAQRERPRGQSGAAPGAGDAGYGAGAEEFFEMSPARSTATPGLAEVIAFRLKFAGFTPVLRDFLNRLQQDSTPLVVRSVEAEPVTNPALAEAETAATRPPFAPQVMQFTVTIEHIRLLVEDPPAS
ncbi:MAG: hypothetical protein IPN11_03240 [Opitutaceae bacterium]|nr:hypothetical protein [Opitutaceae bacterium]